MIAALLVSGRDEFTEVDSLVTTGRSSTKLNQGDVQEGDLVQMGVSVAIVGIPAGLKIPEDMKQLKKLCELPKDGSAPELSFFEIRGRELVLYWRAMEPKQKVNVTIDLISNVPGECRPQALGRSGRDPNRAVEGRRRVEVIVNG